jgi:hypothetical protein
VQGTFIKCTCIFDKRIWGSGSFSINRFEVCFVLACSFTRALSSRATPGFCFLSHAQHREHWDISEEWTNTGHHVPGCHHVCPSPSPGHCHLLHLALAFCPTSNIGNTGISFRNRLTPVHILPNVIILVLVLVQRTFILCTWSWLLILSHVRHRKHWDLFQEWSDIGSYCSDCHHYHPKQLFSSTPCIAVEFVLSHAQHREHWDLLRNEWTQGHLFVPSIIILVIR